MMLKKATRTSHNWSHEIPSTEVAIIALLNLTAGTRQPARGQTRTLPKKRTPSKIGLIVRPGSEEGLQASMRERTPTLQQQVQECRPFLGNHRRQIQKSDT